MWDILYKIPYTYIERYHFLYNVENLRALRFKSSYVFWNGPKELLTQLLYKVICSRAYMLLLCVRWGLVSFSAITANIYTCSNNFPGSWFVWRKYLVCSENSSAHFERTPVKKNPAQMASNAENVSIWWRHHATATRWCVCVCLLNKTNWTNIDIRAWIRNSSITFKQRFS